jgi:ectoine hydroxylase-related dioxygenase (phytanoyl-CoA dioxygenase family)
MTEKPVTSPTAATAPYTSRPFPALTAAQRYHFDVFGYVIVPDVLSTVETASMKDALYRLRRDLRDAKQRGEDRVREARFMSDQPHHVYMNGIEQYDPALTRYVTHPKVVGMSEEIIGGKAHVVEVNAHINGRAPEWPTRPDGTPQFGFHRGLAGHEGTHTRNGLYHAEFVKVLTNLTDLGPDDGGTVVVAGSHKVDAGDKAIIEAAYDDRSLIHQVIAPAGSALLFTEALIHATGQIRSDNERVIIIAGYAVTRFPFSMNPWSDNSAVMHEDFLNSLHPEDRHLFVSKGYLQRNARYRKLEDPM